MGTEHLPSSRFLKSEQPKLERSTPLDGLAGAASLLIMGRSAKRSVCQRFIRQQILRRSDQGAIRFGGGERDRTDDPLLAKQVLSQLSYTPVMSTVSMTIDRSGCCCS